MFNEKKTKNQSQETLQFEVNRQSDTFSFIYPLKLRYGEDWLLAVSSIEVCNSVFDVNIVNKSFSIFVSTFQFFKKIPIRRSWQRLLIELMCLKFLTII